MDACIFSWAGESAYNYWKVININLMLLCNLTEYMEHCNHIYMGNFSFLLLPIVLLKKMPSRMKWINAFFWFIQAQNNAWKPFRYLCMRAYLHTGVFDQCRVFALHGKCLNKFNSHYFVKSFNIISFSPCFFKSKTHFQLKIDFGIIIFKFKEQDRVAIKYSKNSGCIIYLNYIR